MLAPAIQLLDTQKQWLLDKSRFKVGRWSRQTGKSFTLALEAVDDAQESGQNWVLLSAGERQSKELMEKAKMHCEAYRIAASAIEEDRFDAGENKYAMLSIVLPGGNRVIGLPANPDTARGFTANVGLDEFAFHKDSEKIWRALFPTVSRGYKLRAVSTPQGLGNRFHRLCTGENAFVKYVLDIYQAVKEGLPLNIEELRAGIDDPDAWAQEYEVQFIDDASAWISYEMIAACQLDTVPREISYEDVDIAAIKASIQGRVFGGLDIGRRRDLTVLDIEDQVGDVFWQRAMIIFPKVRLTEQKTLLWRLMDALNMERTCIDSTGLGLTIAEDTVERYGSRAEAVTFTSAVKQDLAVRGRNIMEDRRCRIPVCQKLRDDLHAVKKTTTAAGNIRLDSERTDLGHSDRSWAKWLAWMASDSGAEKCELIALG